MEYYATTRTDIYSYTQYGQISHIMLGKEARYKIIQPLWFHLYKIQKWENLIYGVRSHEGKSWQGEVTGKRNGGGRGQYCFSWSGCWFHGVSLVKSHQAYDMGPFLNIGFSKKILKVWRQWLENRINSFFLHRVARLTERKLSDVVSLGSVRNVTRHLMMSLWARWTNLAGWPCN